MIEGIGKVNEVLEQLVTKLKKNYERLEKRAIEAEKALDENSSTAEYEALALLKKDAIMYKILYQYYSQKLRVVIDRAEQSVIEMAEINGDSDSFELEIKAKDFTNINLEELCKGVRGNAVTEEILSSFEMLAGGDAAPKKVVSVSNTRSKIVYESDECKVYDIHPTEDEYIMSKVGNDCAPKYSAAPVGGDAPSVTAELYTAGGNARPLTYETMIAGGGAISETERVRYASGDAKPLTPELMGAGGSEKPITAELAMAGGSSCPLEELMTIGGDAMTITEEVMNAGGCLPSYCDDLNFIGGDEAPLEEKMKYACGDLPSEEEIPANIGGSAQPMTVELMLAGGDAVPVEEKLKYAGGDAAPKTEKKTTKAASKTTAKKSEKKERKTKFSDIKK